MHIDSDLIKKHLETKAFGKKIICLESVGSTNTYLKSLKNIENGTLVTAAYQTEGRGRRGHSFWSPQGGIYMSLACVPSACSFNAGLITTCAALSVCKAIEKLTDLKPKIKWINDIFLNGKKVCGILCETVFTPNTGEIDYVVIGIGVNVAATVFPDELKPIATAILNECEKDISKNELIAEILNSLEKDIQYIYSAEFLNDVRTRSLGLGREITVTTQNGRFLAKAVDIDSSGGLIVKVGENTQTLSSGIVSIEI